jgi:hypothetical protein
MEAKCPGTVSPVTWGNEAMNTHDHVACVAQPCKDGPSSLRTLVFEGQEGFMEEVLLERG